MPKLLRRELIQEIAFLELKKHYSVKERIGEGSYGCVYKAINRRYKSACAIKQLKHDSTSIPKNHELSMLKDIDHPNIVRVFEAYTDDK